MVFVVSALSLESLPLLSQILMLALTIVTGVLVFYLIQPWLRPRKHGNRPFGHVIPTSVTISGQPVIPAAEIPLFNLLQLVSRDVFFVFAKIPFRTLIQVHADDDWARRDVVRTLRTLIADFVLVHPGTMLPSKILMVESSTVQNHQMQASLSLMMMLDRDAGIEIIRLEAQKTYSALELKKILGLDEEE